MMFKAMVLGLLVLGVQTQAGETMDGHLQGYCPVAFSMAGRALKGDGSQRSSYGGKTYTFANASAKAAFDKDPKHYVDSLAFGGACTGAAANGEEHASDPRLFSNYKGKTYLFSWAGGKEEFDKNPQAYAMKAEAAWAKMQAAEAKKAKMKVKRIKAPKKN